MGQTVTGELPRVVVAIAGLSFLACGASTLGLRSTGAMLELTALAGLLALLVLFQPEVRHAFISVDRWMYGQRRRSYRGACGS